MKNPMQQATDALARALVNIATDIADRDDNGPSISAHTLILDLLHPVTPTQADHAARNLTTLGHQYRAAALLLFRAADNNPQEAEAIADRDRLWQEIQRAASTMASEWRTAVTVAVLTEERTEEEQQHLNDLINNPPVDDDEF